jgi:hypothetical protein
MARVRTPSAWESAPDVLRTDLPQQTQGAHPHVRSTPPPVSGERRQSRRRISRRGTYPKQRESQWIQYEGESPQHVPIRDGVLNPPYPVTPPPLERPQPGLPQLGYRAPTPQPALPKLSVQPPVQRPATASARLCAPTRCFAIDTQPHSFGLGLDTACLSYLVRPQRDDWHSPCSYRKISIDRSLCSLGSSLHHLLWFDPGCIVSKNQSDQRCYRESTSKTRD